MKHIHTAGPPSPPFMSRTYSSRKTGTLSPLKRNSHSPSFHPLAIIVPFFCALSPHLTPLDNSRKWNHVQYLSFCVLAQCPQGSSLLEHLPDSPSCLRLNHPPVYVCIAFCFSALLSADTAAASSFWLLGTVVL